MAPPGSRSAYTSTPTDTPVSPTPGWREKTFPVPLQAQCPRPAAQPADSRTLDASGTDTWPREQNPGRAPRAALPAQPAGRIHAHSPRVGATSRCVSYFSFCLERLQGLPLLGVLLWAFGPARGRPDVRGSTHEGHPGVKVLCRHGRQVSNAHLFTLTPALCLRTSEHPRGPSSLFASWPRSLCPHRPAGLSLCSYFCISLVTGEGKSFNSSSLSSLFVCSPVPRGRRRLQGRAASVSVPTRDG